MFEDRDEIRWSVRGRGRFDGRGPADTPGPHPCQRRRCHTVGFSSGPTVLPTGSNWKATTTAAPPVCPDTPPEDVLERVFVADGEYAAFVERSVRYVTSSFRVHDLCEEFRNDYK
jgi:hypothetical protein